MPFRGSFFVPAIEVDPDRPKLCFVFSKRKLVLHEGRPLTASPEAFGLPPSRMHALGYHGQTACFAFELEPDAELPEAWERVELLFAFDRLGPELFDLAGRASQILEWDRTHRFCGVCGTPTQPSEKERARVCPACRHLAFPRLSPAVIVAVERGEEILLARSPHFPRGIYSVLAGFVEPGESAEECVRREVHEETGVHVTDIRYFASQPWPFPHSLMLGFTARYAGGTVRPAEGEIEDAAFFHVDALPKTFSGKTSISQWLLEDFRRRLGRA